MNKKLYKELMTIAEEILQSNDCQLYKCADTIHESYNGQASALGVSTLMVGLKATLAIYYSDAPNKSPKVIDNKSYYDKAFRKLLLDVIVKMLNKKNSTNYSTNDFVRTVMQADEDNQWKTIFIDCSVALKHVIRTYKLG
ncbi:MAG: hypothetical protein IJF00_04090 [Bacteroidaceae bacterium]|nr:hypothetical protein [Bacteroidaceae bacterium]MBQ3121045.1 hypothetical protein [Bacteroidaceae bacterium]